MSYLFTLVTFTHGKHFTFASLFSLIKSFKLKMNSRQTKNKEDTDVQEDIICVFTHLSLYSNAKALLSYASKTGILYFEMNENCKVEKRMETKN